MGLKDLFTKFTMPKPLSPDQLDAPVKPFKKPRKKKDELTKQLDRIPADDEDAKARLERLAKWKSRAERAEAVRRSWETQYEVERCEKYFLGQQWDRGLRQTDVVLNHFLATIKVITPNLLFSQPKYYIRPRQGRTAPAGELRAAMAEGVLDFIGGQDNNLKKSAKLAVLQAFFRLGVLKMVYDPRMVPNPAVGELVYEVDEEGVVLNDADGNPVPMRNPLTGETITEPKEVLTDELYRYTYVDSRHLLLPDEGADPQRWTWIGEQVLAPLAHAKADTRFPERLRDQFTANTSGINQGSYAHIKSVQDDEQFMYTECYDMIGKRMIIWADGQGFEDFLVDDLLPPGIEDHPYALLMLGESILGPTPCPWPMPFTKAWLEPQREYNISRQQIMEGGKRSARKVVYDESTFPDSDEAVKFLQDPSDMGAAKVNDVTRPPLVLPTPDINPAIYKNVPMLMNDWRIITGQTGARLSGPEGSTATESTFVERAANLRDAELQDLIQDWLADSGKKMLQLVKKTLTLGLWIKMRGFSDKEFMKYAERYFQMPQEQMQALMQGIPGLKEMIMLRFGDEKWEMVTREQLTFEADVSVAPGSMRPRNLDLERKNWFELLKIIGQFPQLALSRELLKETASKFEGINDRMLDELTALAEKMINIQSNVAGREGGDQNGGGAGSATAGNPDLAAMMSGIQGGM